MSRYPADPPRHAAIQAQATSSYLKEPEAAGTARIDQSAFSDSASYITKSHATTTQYSASVMGGAANQRQQSEFGTSVYSYSSSRDGQGLVREINGRKFNTMNDAYVLPTDDNEWARLDKQHSALVVAFDGLYPNAEVVNAVLAPVEDGEPKRILDVGCGTGSWAIEMATRFPHSEVMGIDLAPPPVDSSLFPPNLRFEIDDVNQPLTHFHNMWDFIHMRCVASGISDIEKTLRELQLCLKPGGFLLVIDGDIDLWKDDRSGTIPMVRLPGDEDVNGVSPTGSWLRRIFWETHQASVIAGSCFHHSVKVLDRGFYDYPLLDPETVAGGGVFIPIGTWAKGSNETETQMLAYAGTLTRQNFLEVHRGYQKILRQHGIDQATLDHWGSQIDQELPSPHNRVWVRYRFCWGRRRAGDGLPAPELPALPSPASSKSSSPSGSPRLPTIMEGSPKSSSGVKRRRKRSRYPGLQVYSNSEEAVRETKKRIDSKGVLPTPAVTRAWLAAGGALAT